MKQTIVITGTSSGFGTLMVKTFSNAGHTVIATMRNAATKNKEVAEELGKLPGVEVVELNVADDTSVNQGIAYILEKYGKIDVLINNAAIQGNGLLEAYSIAQIQKIMDVNVYGILRLYKEVLPAMRAVKNGLIINISSSSGRVSIPFQVPYNTSKFAIESITEGGYEELIGQGIETVLIEPGAFLTELYAKEGTHADRADILESYGDDTLKIITSFSEKFGATLMKHQPDIQIVADAAVTLVNMEKGTRPLRTPIDPIAGGLEVEYNDATTEIKGRWMKMYIS
ncbi:SDR family NAD(P)-dependent oxidoreductase [Dyadobacter subterraneus]|uniref:SDR family NAD(P)-dependent oxidoreductase n=1 Tax=Dyadobacter subterraneus TaxID=2773304 RepID=A0ABR9W7E4_9BACT|nr:SDR family NAD(P)-dependent oxidoreductase [Dyadobacter subterraneus]MBE9461343.1 SDR family NAD(P)-dependent oxidoreductase [Dyadobacter subterraneus]